jgi:hypothetical protein
MDSACMTLSLTRDIKQYKIRLAGVLEQISCLIKPGYSIVNSIVLNWEVVSTLSWQCQRVNNMRDNVPRKCSDPPSLSLQPVFGF